LLSRDTDLSTASKVLLPSYNDLFNKINYSNFLEFAPHNSPEIRTLDAQVFPKIKCPLLHMVASKSHVLPYVEALEWIISHTDDAKCLINDDQGKCVGFFLLVEVNKYYKLRELKVRLNIDFVVAFYDKHNTRKLLES